MIDTSIVASLILGVSGTGGVIAWRKMGAEKTAVVVGYQTTIIEDLGKDNERLHTENRRLNRENESLKIRVRSLEVRISSLERKLS